MVRVGRRADFNHLRRHPGFQAFPSFGRVYAAYGAYLLFWLCFGGGWSNKNPDLYDWAGAVICLAGVSVMLWAPRG
ncbi:hypothetical protein PO124_17045 [Bacillus licheniformis]|nr:hypothetical protein [Bacillus licheniformis]